MNPTSKSPRHGGRRWSNKVRGTTGAVGFPERTGYNRKGTDATSGSLDEELRNILPLLARKIGYK